MRSTPTPVRPKPTPYITLQSCRPLNPKPGQLKRHAKPQLCSAWVLIEVHTPVGGSVQMTPGRMVAELAASVLPHHNSGNCRDRLPPRSLAPSLSPLPLPPSFLPSFPPLLFLRVFSRSVSPSLACLHACIGYAASNDGDKFLLSLCLSVPLCLSLTRPSDMLSVLFEPILMGPPPPALGAALAAAATPEPTAPITESGAYLPMTSGGWILTKVGDISSCQSRYMDPATSNDHRVQASD